MADGPTITIPHPGIRVQLVAPCRIAPGDWCRTCADPNPYADGWPAASYPGEPIDWSTLAYAPMPSCPVCTLARRCVCTTPPEAVTP